MLETLRIINYALIDKLTIDFEDKLNIFTGATGAGKTIIIEALGSVCGERLFEQQIRTGAKSASIEAVFSVPPGMTLPEEVQACAGKLILRREVQAGGRSRAFVNDRQVTSQLLRRLGSLLTDITGQYQQRGLLDPDNQLRILDRYAGLTGQLETLDAAYRRYIQVRAELQQIRRRQQEAAVEKELLEFQIKEIETASLREGEQQALEEERLRLVNAEQVKAACDSCQQLLFDDPGCALERLKLAAKELTRISKFISEAGHLRERLEELAIQLEEISAGLRHLEQGAEYDPMRLEFVAERLELIRRLNRKYGQSVAAVLDYLAQARSKLQTLGDYEAAAKKLETELAVLQQDLSRRAIEISERRQKAAADLRAEVLKHLADLAMVDADFVVRFGRQPVEEGPYMVDGQHVAGDGRGFDRVEFHICTNPGEGLKPLASTASGGELSRLLLAICCAVGEAFMIPTIVFDEIDAGISGAVASMVAKKLRKLAASRQVICVTHLQQIASAATTHFKVYKAKSGQRAVTRVKRLDEAERLKEIARLLAGEKISEITLDQAAQLLKESHN